MCSEQVLKSRRPDKLNELKFKYFRQNLSFSEQNHETMIFVPLFDTISGANRSTK